MTHTPKKIKYEEETHTLRFVPENYCIASMFYDGKAIDAAVDVDATGKLIQERFNVCEGLNLEAIPGLIKAVEILAHFDFQNAYHNPHNHNLARGRVLEALNKLKGEK